MLLSTPPVVKVKGIELPQCDSLHLDQRINNHHVARVVVSGFSKESGSNNSFFKDLHEKYLGQEISIEIPSSAESKSSNGNASPNKFIGVVCSLSVLRREASSFDAVLTAYSPTILLEDGLNCRSFYNKTLKDIFTAVTNSTHSALKDPSCNANPNSQLEYVVQYKETNYNFLSRLASETGQWFYFDGEKLHFGKLSPKGGSVNLVLGKELTYFDISLNLTSAEFSWVGYDYLEDKAVEASDTKIQVDGLPGFAMDTSKKVFKDKNVLLVPVTDVDIQQQAEQLVQETADGLLIARGNSESSDLGIGTKIVVSQLNGPKNALKKSNIGEFIITQITHHYSGSGMYSNSFEAVPPDTKFQPYNSKILRPVCENQPAEVVDTKDEEKMGRVKVRFFWQKDYSDSDLPWVRVATNQAGQGYGTFILPEVGNKVMVGFDQNNPELPFVIGGFFTGKLKPEESLYDKPDNVFKSIKTRRGNEIRFSDVENEEFIHILNREKGNELLLSLKGDGEILIKTKGLLKLEAKDMEFLAETMKMTIEEGLDISSKTASIKSEDQISISSKTVEVKADSDMSIKSNELTMEAQSQAELKGNSQLSLKAGGQVEVKGGIIKLN